MRTVLVAAIAAVVSATTLAISSIGPDSLPSQTHPTIADVPEIIDPTTAHGNCHEFTICGLAKQYELPRSWVTQEARKQDGPEI